MRPVHLLILDCDVERREQLLELLRGAGHHVVAAPDAATTAEAVGQGFDALVLDLGCPELDRARLREALVPEQQAEPESLERTEGRHIALMLRYTEGNKRRAAQLLGISRSTLLHKVRKYGLNRPGRE